MDELVLTIIKYIDYYNNRRIIAKFKMNVPLLYLDNTA
ncbi:hypothetical protein CG473_01310 [Mycoplasma testudineum]|nr:hypothetical protein CG473_01310 [Mycoplasma testudineum]